MKIWEFPIDFTVTCYKCDKEIKTGDVFIHLFCSVFCSEKCLIDSSTKYKVTRTEDKE